MRSRKRSIRKMAFVLIILVFLMYSLAACGSADVETVYQNARTKTAELKDVDMEMTIDLEMTDGSLEMDMKTESQLKVHDLHSETMIFDMFTTMKMEQGFLQETRMYYSDGWSYMDINGQKTKVAMKLEEAVMQVSGSTGLSEWYEGSFTELSMERKDESYIITYAGNVEEIANQVEEDVAEVLQDLMDTYGLELELKEVSGRLIVDSQGYISENNMNLGLTIIESGVEYELSITAAIVYNNLGEEISVELPDLDEYVVME